MWLVAIEMNAPGSVPAMPEKCCAAIIENNIDGCLTRMHRGNALLRVRKPQRKRVRKAPFKACSPASAPACLAGPVYWSSAMR